MNDALIGFAILTVFTIFCFAICWYEKWQDRKEKPKYAAIFHSTLEKIQSVSGGVSYISTVYGVTPKGKRKVLAKTLEYRRIDAAQKEAELLEQILKKKYNLKDGN